MALLGNEAGQKRCRRGTSDTVGRRKVGEMLSKSDVRHCRAANRGENAAEEDVRHCRATKRD